MPIPMYVNLVDNPFEKKKIGAIRGPFSYEAMIIQVIRSSLLNLLIIINLFFVTKNDKIIMNMK